MGVEIGLIICSPGREWWKHACGVPSAHALVVQMAMYLHREFLSGG
jgi:hypothetical protein